MQLLATFVTVPINRANRLVSGFTMIELLVTVAVAGIALALAVPSFTQMTVSSRLTTQANEVVAALNLARSEAIKRNVRVSFCRVESEDAVDCELARGPWTHWVVTTGDGGNVIRRGVVNTFSGGISMRSTLTEDQVTFRPEGLAYSGDLPLSPAAPRTTWIAFIRFRSRGSIRARTPSAPFPPTCKRLRIPISAAR